MNQGHSTYVASVVQYLRDLAGRGPADAAERVCQLGEKILMMLALDLEPARPLLESCYVHRPGTAAPGRPAHDPVSMLRCLLVMVLEGVTSITEWVKHLRGHPELVMLSGLTPGRSPGVGTFYDFFDRLLDGPRLRPCSHTSPRPSRLHRGNRGRFRRKLKEEKKQVEALRQAALAGRNEGRVKASARQAQQTLDQPHPDDFAGRLNTLLMRLGVMPSAQAGLLGDVRRLVVCGDGSALASGAARFGHSLCSCREQGVEHCECPRSYSDPTATWGWDCHHDAYVFGHRLMLLGTAGTGHDLPLYLKVAGAHEPDVIMGVEAVAGLHKLLHRHLPHAAVAYGVFDKGFDATEYYRFLVHLGIAPIIPLHNEAAPTPQDDQGRRRDADGTPLCPGGARMWHHSFNKKSGKHVYCCPAKYTGRCNGKSVIRTDLVRCPHGQLCDPSSVMGPMVLLSVEDDPRLSPPVPRDSELFKKLYNQRTTTERFFSQAKVGAGLERRPWRRDHIFGIGALACALICHARARLRHQLGNVEVRSLPELLALIDRTSVPEPLARAA